MIDLKTFTYIDILQPQLTGFLQTVVPGFNPLVQAALFVEIAPGLAINLRMSLSSDGDAWASDRGAGIRSLGST